MSKQAIMEALKKSLGETLNEDVASEISSHLDQLVSDRTSAQTLELNEKVQKLVKENKLLKAAIRKQEAEFKEEAEKFAAELAEGFAQKESILFEEIENYKRETVNVIKEVSEEYRTKVEEMVAQEATEFRSLLENDMIEEAKNFRLVQEAALAEDVKTYQKDVLEKLDQFLEAEIPNNIPEGIMEAAAKNKALEEIVEGVMNVFGDKSIRLDEASEKVLKDAQKEYENLSESYNAKVKEAVALTAKVRELEKDNKIARLTEGMTIAQKKIARKLLESATASDVERRFESVKDIIIKESVKPTKKSILTEKAKVDNREQSKQVEKQLQNLRESAKPEPKKKSGLEAEMESWKKQVDRTFRRF